MVEELYKHPQELCNNHCIALRSTIQTQRVSKLSVPGAIFKLYGKFLEKVHQLV